MYIQIVQGLMTKFGSIVFMVKIGFSQDRKLGTLHCSARSPLGIEPKITFYSLLSQAVLMVNVWL